MASKNAPNLIISAAGWLMQFVTLLIKGLTIRGWDNERIHALVTDKSTADLERGIDAFVNALAKSNTERVIDEVVKFLTEPTDSTIDPATGICSFAVDFPVSGGEMVVVDAKLFHFNCTMTSDAVERELEAAGYRSAVFAELLAFGAEYPEVQRQFPVIALGSVAEADGVRCVPVLGKDGTARTLFRIRCDSDWFDACRFLAVRK